MWWLALIACDSGHGAKTAQRTHGVSLATLDLQGLPVPLPKHGLAVQTYGMGDSYIEVLDRDAKTLRVIAEHWDREQGPQHQDKTITLDATTLAKLDTLSDRAWREEPHGKMPQVTDVSQHLMIVDGDDAFDLHADMIGFTDATESATRPGASALVVAVAAAAQPLLVPPLPVALNHRHGHAIDRATLSTAAIPGTPPVHGLVVRQLTTTSDQWIVIDADRNELRLIANGKETKRDVNPQAVLDLVHLAAFAWNEEGAAMQVATDVREDLYVFDADEAFYLSGHPLSAEAAQTGRPAASQLMTAVYRFAK